MKSRRIAAAGVALLLFAVGCDGEESAGESAAAVAPTAAGTPRVTSEVTVDEADDITSEVTVEGPGDITSEVEVRVSNIISEYEGTETDVGTLLTVPARVLFDFDEATLRSDARETLDKILEVLGFYEDAPVEVLGHTDACGTEEYNQDLSERRAQAVVEFLLEEGVDDARLIAEGRGESEPVVPVEGGECREQANRRVEVLIRGVSPPDVDQDRE